jgi:hypothetical protein
LLILLRCSAVVSRCEFPVSPLLRRAVRGMGTGCCLLIGTNQRSSCAGLTRASTGLPASSTPVARTWMAGSSPATTTLNCTSVIAHSDPHPSRFSPDSPALLREFAGKGLICLTVFAPKRRLPGENQQNSRFLRGKPGIFPRRHGPWRSLPTTAPSCTTGGDRPVAGKPPASPPSNSVPSYSV